jgi:hypothetical protein
MLFDEKHGETLFYLRTRKKASIYGARSSAKKDGQLNLRKRLAKNLAVAFLSCSVLRGNNRCEASFKSFDISL